MYSNKQLSLFNPSMNLVSNQIEPFSLSGGVNLASGDFTMGLAKNMGESDQFGY